MESPQMSNKKTTRRKGSISPTMTYTKYKNVQTPKIKCKSMSGSPALPVDNLTRVLKEKYSTVTQKLTTVPMTNNQKGRIRQLVRDKLKGVPQQSMPEILYRKILHILETTNNLTDSDLRKIKILFNMYKNSLLKECSTEDSAATPEVSSQNQDVKVVKVKKEKVKKLKGALGKGDSAVEKLKSDEPQKIKGPKRYTVFLGNLPLYVDRNQILHHFSDLAPHIVGVRIPKQSEGKKSSIAYLELKNESTFEMALSKHHTMLGNRRINVLYTTQKNSKIDKTEAKSKTAKLVAMQRAGQLIGSIPLHKKRSARRKKMRLAQAKEAKENNSTEK